MGSGGHVILVGQLLGHDHLVLVEFHLLQPGLVKVQDLDALAAALLAVLLMGLIPMMPPR